MINQIEQLEGRVLLAASVSGGVLTVTGSDSADRIVITQQKKSVVVREGAHVSHFAKNVRISHIVVNALGGKDRIRINAKIGATVDGGDGNDLIQGGAGSDLLAGGNGNDRVFGNGGNDSISGDAGRDVLFGGAGDDIIDAYDTQADKLSGGEGSDRARVDTNVDTAWNIEGYQAITSSASGDPIGVDYSGTLRVTGGANPFTVTNSGLGAATLSSAVINAGGLTGSVFDGMIDSARLNFGNIAFGSFDDQINIRLTRVGDLNLDGVVTIADFIDLASNFNTNPVVTWQEGDLNYDHSVTISDFVDLAANFNTNYGAITSTTGVAGSTFTTGMVRISSGVATMNINMSQPILGGRLVVYTNDLGLPIGTYTLADTDCTADGGLVLPNSSPRFPVTYACPVALAPAAPDPVVNDPGPTEVVEPQAAAPDPEAAMPPPAEPEPAAIVVGEESVLGDSTAAPDEPIAEPVTA